MWSGSLRAQSRTIVAKFEVLCEPGSGAVVERFGDIGATLAKEMLLVAKERIGLSNFLISKCYYWSVLIVGGVMKSFILPIDGESARKYLLNIDAFPTWSRNFLDCRREGEKYLLTISTSQIEEVVEVVAQVQGEQMMISGVGQQLIRSFTLEWGFEELNPLPDGTPQTLVRYEFSISTKLPMPGFLRTTLENKFISQIIEDITKKFEETRREGE